MFGNKYISIIIWILSMWILSGLFYRMEYRSGRVENRINPIFAFLVIAPVIWMAAHRGYIGDTHAYIVNFMKLPSSLSEIPYATSLHEKGKGFFVLSSLIKIVFGNNTLPYFFIIALVQAGILAAFFRFFSEDYVFSVFLFMASSDYMSWMFNGIRQFTAVAISMLAVWIILSSNYLSLSKYIIVILIIMLAASFHSTALIMLIIVFVSQGEVWNRKTILFMITCVLIVAFVERFTTVLDTALSATEYANVVSDYTSLNDDGTNPIRVLFYSIPAIISFFGRKRIRESGDRVINVCANMSILSMGLYLISMVTSGVFFGRLPIYCSLYAYVLLPWEMHWIFRRRVFTIIVIITYLLFYYYQMHITWSFI